MARPEKKMGGNDVIFYDVSRNSNKQVNYVFQQVIFCAAAYFFSPFLRKHSVLHWITFIGKKHLHYITFMIYVPVNHSTLLIYLLTDNTAQPRNMISWLWLYLTAKRISKNRLNSTFASTLSHRRSQDFDGSGAQNLSR